MNAEKVIGISRTVIKVIIVVSIVGTFVKNFIPRTADTIVIGTTEQSQEAEPTDRSKQALVQAKENDTPAVTSVTTVNSAEYNTAVTSSSAATAVTSTAPTEPVIIIDQTAGAYSHEKTETTPAAVRAQTAAVPAEPTEPTEQAQSDLINVNTASAEELMTLNGIGEVKAQAIIDYREENGGFSDIDELINVKGIGEKTLEKIRSSVTI
ncbi:MAG: helix-hairpin-helix domain-containing protein [Oscillospiraceae bacterium]